MYSYKDSLVLPSQLGSYWQSQDISGKTLQEVQTEYRGVYLILNHPASSEDLYVKLDYTVQWQSSSTMTISQLISAIGNNAVMIEDKLPNEELADVRYEEARRAQYKIELAKIGYHYPDNHPRAELTDLELTRPKVVTDLSLVHKNCLISVNGYFHMTDSDGERLFVKDGGKTCVKSNNNHIGLHSFMDIGEIQKIPLYSTFLEPFSEESSLRDRISITLDNIDVEGKSILLVIGGYLVFPEENVFWQYGEESFALDLKSLSYVERIMESSHFLDLSELKLTDYNFHDTAYDFEELWSDDVIFKYLTMSQSFIVVIDSEFLSLQKIHIRHNSYPGMFTSSVEPIYPLVTGYGKIGEYWKTHEDGFWAVNIHEGYLRNYLFNLRNQQDMRIITDQVLPSNPAFNSRGTMLRISGTKR